MDNLEQQIRESLNLYSLTPDFARKRAHSLTLNNTKLDFANSEPGKHMKKVDATVGGVTGALTGGATGVYASKYFDKEEDSLAKVLVRRILGGLLGASAGGAIGASAGITLGKTDIINKLYQKLGKLTQNAHIAKRDAVGRMQQYLNTSKRSLADKDEAFINMLTLPLDYKDAIKKELHKSVNKLG